MSKTQNQITMRKVCIIIQSLVSRRQNHHSSYSSDYVKHHTLLTLKRRKNVVDDVTNVELHGLLGFDASRPLSDVIPERTNSLAVVEGMHSRFFLTTAVASTIGHVCQVTLKCKSPGERELGVVQDARSWRPIPEGTDLIRRPAAPHAKWVRSGTYH